jgi:hypothetical protein
LWTLDAVWATGKLTRVLAGMATGANSRIIAVEPVRAMRQQLIRSLRTAANANANTKSAKSADGKSSNDDADEGVFGNIEVRHGTAHTLRSALGPDRVGRVDAIVSGQAFHWFEPYDGARDEFRRVLRPGTGTVALVWNRRDEWPPLSRWPQQGDPSVSIPAVATAARVAEGAVLQRGLIRIVRPFEGDTPRHTTGRWKDCWSAAPIVPVTTEAAQRLADGRADAAAVGFYPLRWRTFGWHFQIGTRAMLLDRTLSVSFMAGLDAPTRARVVGQVDALIGEVGGDPADDKRVYVLPYVTDVYSTQRLPQ